MRKKKKIEGESILVHHNNPLGLRSGHYAYVGASCPEGGDFYLYFCTLSLCYRAGLKRIRGIWMYYGEENPMTLKMLLEHWDRLEGSYYCNALQRFTDMMGIEADLRLPDPAMMGSIVLYSRLLAVMTCINFQLQRVHIPWDDIAKGFWLAFHTMMSDERKQVITLKEVKAPL